MASFNEQALAAKAQLTRRFRRQGVSIAILSSVLYGMFTAFMTLAMSIGVWLTFKDDPRLSSFTQVYLIGALGAGVLNFCSAAWAFLFLAIKGKLGDFWRSLISKPGGIVFLVALAGGPLASTFYVLGLQTAGSIIVPISALCTAFGALFGHFLLKQYLTVQKSIGVLICLAASVLIGSTSLSADAPPNLLLGMGFGLLAALAWGIEGCIGGYASALIDSDISITIRQLTAALGTMGILVPIFAIIGSAPLGSMLAGICLDGQSMLAFAVASFCAYLTYLLWYKGNAMCGTALGMACNGMFSFWGPFCCWLILGVCFGLEGYDLPFVVWIGAVLMVAGIFVIAVQRKEKA
ncbi:MAG: hypothetical protein IJU76_01205 [Desulfovibrionaceae bacterium]|nr:hypothetical protein [Desulfovibrionaceae bacterium]